MKKAFTMLELVFVIVVVGILSYFVSTGFQRNPLREAADQLVSHIRYTQHLAMMDDKFSLTDASWALGRWQLYFSNNTGSDDQWAYTIFSDWKAGHTGNPDMGEVAVNPLNSSQYLTGGTSGTNIIHYSDQSATKELNIGHKYGIKDITFSGGCRSNVKYIHFDYLGRPMNSLSTNPYELPATGWHKLLTTQCKITLCDKDCTDGSAQKVSIAIEAETGYTHIL
ncbi:type II secretion system protein [Sulfurospirillum diekertiae]|uniref:Type II secretion system protein n=1 Tax=Sulfurospirillum diekertiae TaxID=1854492 RepID=A0A6G9VS84_9BACT|nr:type II secretion system protein [Sulfurospirillum diekertiae]QIR75233.1 type II secretion system protein [Sulfurospirillum diekertiae]QIR77884.1 type II secretion system protein [Sulfurospirillum diekertiae]